MTGIAPATAENAAVPPATYACTFGLYNQEAPWTDVRQLSWTELAAQPTTHTIGRKEGTCLVPAIFSGTKRAKSDAARIDVVFLDSDSGCTLVEIKAAPGLRAGGLSLVQPIPTSPLPPG